MKLARSKVSTLPPKPRPIPGFTVDRETLDHLDTLHRAVAEILIARGEWHLV